MTVDTFRTGFTGNVLVPTSEGYDDARALWNGDINRRPQVIAQCRTTDEVVSAIGFGREEGLEVAVRGGGHNFAGHGLCEGGLMIDLSPMRDVKVDPGARRARCGGGTTWAELDAATQAHGLATPGGVISHTGVGGLTLGGGIGWLTRRAGLSCDNLVSARVVTADGRVLTASEAENPDLHWALRGGGGNFGVVTEFEFALHEVGPMVNLGLFFWGIEQGVEALRFVREYTASVPPGTGVQLIGLNAPPAPFVPEAFHLAPGYGLAVVGWGSPEEHAGLVQPIRDTLPPSFEFVTPLPYAALQQMLDESAPWGILGYEKALYLDELSDGAIDVVTDHFPAKSSPMSIMPVFPLGGTYHDVADDATAFGGSRATKWVFNIAAIAPTQDLLDADRAWVRSMYDALQPFAVGIGTYVNFLSDADEDRIRASYGPAKYERLARIKAEYDPENLFHLNANIKPSKAAAR
ncbi:MAG TPA: FAD-binding oxidoreductase [Acidimicrobiales bacterium]|nr:FAD-binding oxidoreductase [Acidimicrobiales bacterium]